MLTLRAACRLVDTNSHYSSEALDFQWFVGNKTPASTGVVKCFWAAAAALNRHRVMCLWKERHFTKHHVRAQPPLVKILLFTWLTFCASHVLQICNYPRNRRWTLTFRAHRVTTANGFQAAQFRFIYLLPQEQQYGTLPWYVPSKIGNSLGNCSDLKEWVEVSIYRVKVHKTAKDGGQFYVSLR